MTVRREKRRDPESGATREFWMVDVSFTHQNGRRQRIRKVSPVQTRRGAEAYERELRASLLAGTHGREEVEVPTLEQFAKEFIDGYARANNKPSEVAAKGWICRLHLVPMLGGKRLSDIGPRDIERYKAAKLDAGLKASTINNQLMTLGKMLRVAVEWGVLESAPTVKRLRAPKPEFDFLDFGEAERLVQAVDPEWRCMVVTALHTGLRLGELMGLQWGDCDLTAGRIMVRRSVWKSTVGTPKSGRNREVPLNAIALSALKAHRHLRGQWVFCQEDGSRLAQFHCKPPLRRACRRAGLRSVQWHCMRHTFASHLVMRGVPLKAVQELLGHASMEMTMRYAHLSPDVRRDAVDKLVDVPPDGNMMATDARTTATRPVPNLKTESSRGFEWWRPTTDYGYPTRSHRLPASPAGGGDALDS